MVSEAQLAAREGDIAPDDTDEEFLITMLRGLTDEIDMLRKKLGMAGTDVKLPVARDPAAQGFDPDAGITLASRLTVTTADALMKAAQPGKPTVFLVKGQHKGANQQLYGFIPEAAPKDSSLGYTTVAGPKGFDNTLNWGMEDSLNKAPIQVSH